MMPSILNLVNFYKTAGTPRAFLIYHFCDPISTYSLNVHCACQNLWSIISKILSLHSELFTQLFFFNLTISNWNLVLLFRPQTLWYCIFSPNSPIIASGGWFCVPISHHYLWVVLFSYFLKPLTFLVTEIIHFVAVINIILSLNSFNLHFLCIFYKSF
jgi:hypothetical protein